MYVLSKCFAKLKLQLDFINDEFFANTSYQCHGRYVAIAVNIVLDFINFFYAQFYFELSLLQQLSRNTLIICTVFSMQW